MSSNSKTMRSIALAVVFAASAAGAARADDNSMSMWTGESYASFNGGKNLPNGKPVFDMTQSTFRRTNPQGLSDRQYQALNSGDPFWQIPDPNAARELAASDTATAWRASHPGGFRPREYESMESFFAWSLTPDDIQAIEVENKALVAKLAGKEPQSEQVARIFQGRWLTSAK